MKTFVVKKKVNIKAKPLEVWDALTNPEKTRKYFFNCNVYSAWKPGSPIVFKGRFLFFFTFEMKGEILKAEPGKVLQYTLQNTKSHPPSISTVTDELTYEKR